MFVTDKYLFLRGQKKVKKMENEKDKKRKMRSDTGGSHRAYTYGGKGVEMLNFVGDVEDEFRSLRDAVDRNDVGASYQGILACCNGRTRKHCGKVWRWKV